MGRDELSGGIRHTNGIKEPDSMKPVPTLELEPNKWKVGFLSKTWMWLDYKKSYIGLVVMGLGKISTIWLGPAGEGIFYLGSALAGIGVAHKGLKAVQTTKEKGGEGKWWEVLLQILIEFLKTFAIKKGV